MNSMLMKSFLMKNIRMKSFPIKSFQKKSVLYKGGLTLLLTAFLMTALLLLPALSPAGAEGTEPPKEAGNPENSLNAQETAPAADTGNPENTVLPAGAQSTKNALILSEIESEEDTDITENPDDTEVTQLTAEKAVLEEGNLRDNMALYADQDIPSIITMYLTVTEGNAADGTDHTWTEINTYSVYDYEAMATDRYKAEGLLQIDEKGEGLREGCFGFGETLPNVSVQVRGQSSSQSAQKNYKIRIKKGRGEFREQRTLNLNKHYSDNLRFINKLCYRFVQRIPQLIGGRTQFVRLFVKDLTAGGSGEYQDYGLYTMVEQVNRTFLKNHGLDENGQLYKVTFFEWKKYAAVMMSEEDPEFDRDAFNAYLEIKGSEEHGDLRSAIEDINNYLKPIQETVEERFCAENLCCWMAVNILISNYDSHARNLFLYSPLNSEKFYVIPWDLDDSLRGAYNRKRNYSEGGSWERGFQMFLGLNLTNRMLKEQVYRDMLTKAVEDLYHNYLQPETVDRDARSLASVVEPLIFDETGADYENLRIKDPAEYEELVESVSKEITLNYEYYHESIRKPWPFFVDLPVPDPENGELILSWDTSYDINGEALTYDYILARDYAFTDVLSHGEGLVIPTVAVPAPSPGRYYLRVIARNESGYTMDCFDYYSTHVNGKAYGCYAFMIHEDGTAEAYIEAGV